MDRRGEQDVADQLDHHVARLRREVMGCCLSNEVERELLGRLHAAEKAAAARHAAGVVHHVDLFVLALRRQMGREITNRTAVRWADLVIFDIKRPFGDPGQMFAEVLELAQAIELAGGTGVDWFGPRVRPQPPDAARVGEEMAEVIRSHDLPEDVESRLLALTGEMVRLGPAATTRAEALAFVDRASEFHTVLASVQGTFITTTQANVLRGRVFFALCSTLIYVVVQIALAVAAITIVIAGLKVAASSAAIGNRLRSAESTIKPCTSKQSEVEGDVAASLDGLTLDEMKELRDKMTKIIDEGTFPNPRERQKWRWARAKVEQKIAELEANPPK